MIEGKTVYVLELADGRYYVGSTSNRKRRYNEHASRRGSKWTRIHAPLCVHEEYRRVPSPFLLGMESRVTANLMLRYGVNNVRGSMFCTTRDYHMGDVDSLTRFLGHYNDMDYREVYAKLSRILPMPPADNVRGGGGTSTSASRTAMTANSRRRRKYHGGNYDSGHDIHYGNNNNNVDGGNHHPRGATLCYNCGELGHIAASCPNNRGGGA
ncbi:hypothetical protein ACHAXA_011613 [Cyclostephanos tholiformis]|uniref:CCHC-type domain-containing protein n=1 Tax=Cyclostephanos tholiformis TaxID=382380 RepID=A0ABD3RV84_9STRA